MGGDCTRSGAVFAEKSDAILSTPSKGVPDGGSAFAVLRGRFNMFLKGFSIRADAGLAPNMRRLL